MKPLYYLFAVYFVLYNPLNGKIGRGGASALSHCDKQKYEVKIVTGSGYYQDFCRIDIHPTLMPLAGYQFNGIL